jgi:hypothetical protein
MPNNSQRWPFDVAQNASPVACDHWIPVDRFLNNGTTQSRLGVGLNFTQDSNIVGQDFGIPGPYFGLFPLNASSGDSVRQNGVPNLEYLLSQDVKIAFIYGDRDYRCPWTGAEMTALALKWDGQEKFSQAGYEVMEQTASQGDAKTHSANEDLTAQQRKALVKQHGLFSFTRVMDAGHAVSAFAPSTVAEIWRRAVVGKDVVSGGVDVFPDGYGAGSNYSTKGPKTSWEWRNEFPPSNFTFTCMVAGEWSGTNPWMPILEAEADTGA